MCVKDTVRLQQELDAALKRIRDLEKEIAALQALQVEDLRTKALVDPAPRHPRKGRSKAK